MTDNDLTVAILREIRDEIRMTRGELKAEIAATNTRLDATNSRLETVDHTLSEFAGQHLLLTRYVKNVIDRHDQAIEELRERVTKLEGHAGER